ncbi:SLAC1 anion channel family protein [Niveibacterium sp. SC-1]|uniref:SLAC1 anion channel family protein n=1 Tax=Niveibacterium sp. SC-1 TaxID=3135646 RepID=UPI00311D8CAC
MSSIVKAGAPALTPQSSPASVAPAAPGVAEGLLHYLPVSLFGAVMGLTGLSVAWRLAAQRFATPGWLADAIALLAIASFLALSVGYVVKLVTSPKAVRAEWQHPVAGNLFGTVFISLLLLPLLLAPHALPLARGLWTVGALGMLAFGWHRVDRWVSAPQQIAHATPAWVVPVVGMLDIPIAAPALGLPQLHPVMVLGLAVGLFFAIPVFTLVFARLVFEAPMPPALQPSLLILLAPFAVGGSAYGAVTGRIDLFAEALYLITLFLLAVLGLRLREVLRCCPFKLGWWAVSFPLAATAISALRMAGHYDGRLADLLALGLLGLATAAIAWLTLRTLLGVLRGELRALST